MTDLVIVKTGHAYNTQKYHEPHPDDPTKPKCGTRLGENTQWSRKPKARIPHHTLCGRCAGKDTVEGPNGPQISKKLRLADPEVV